VLRCRSAGEDACMPSSEVLWSTTVLSLGPEAKGSEEVL
jgi:hypothetical protein